MSRPGSLRPEPAGTDIRPAAAAGPMFTVSALSAGPGISRVSATGRLVGDAAADRLAAVLQHQRATGCRFVHLDLAELPLLDRAGFDVLIAAHHEFVAAGGALAMTGVVPRIVRLLQLTGMDQTLFLITGTRDVRQTPGDPALVDRAVRILMGRAGCDVTEATIQLLTRTYATSRTLGEVARSMLADHTTPDRGAAFGWTADDADLVATGPEPATRETSATA